MEHIIFNYLDQLEIAHKTLSHPPLFSAKDGDDLKKDLSGAHIKNLFLKSEKNEFVLVCLIDTSTLDIKQFSKNINHARFSFASPEYLKKYLNILPGSVTPFAVIHNQEPKIPLYLDEDIFKFETINCHPLRNDMTTTIKTNDLILFLKSLSHPFHITKLPKIIK